MTSTASSKLIVFYDALCPSCVKDRENYERWAGTRASHIVWKDASSHEALLKSYGVSLEEALLELHVFDEAKQCMYKEMDAYIHLMKPIPRLWVFSVLIRLPIVRPALSFLYRRCVTNRLKKQGRVCKLPK